MPVDDLTAGIFKLRFKALGTECEVQFRTPSVEAAKEFRAVALEWIRNFERTWSRFIPESLLCRINAEAGRSRVELTPEQEEVVQLCERTYQATDGLVDPTSFPLTRLWDEASKADRLPSEDEIDEVLRHVSWPSVEWGNGSVFLPEKGMALEIGGFGKEYAVDQISALAKNYDLPAVLVDLGRDLVTYGEPPHGPYWVIGVEDARIENDPAIRLAFTDMGLATSGNGRRFRTIGGEKFGHIIDPRTGIPVRNALLTATCLADDCLTAGWFSTAACILGPKMGLEKIECRFGIEGMLQTTDTTLYSQNIHRHVIAS